MNKSINNNISTQDKTEAESLYRQGLECWKQGDRAGAIACYTASAKLNPDGPGKTALELTDSIMDFYDTNQFNP